MREVDLVALGRPFPLEAIRQRRGAGSVTLNYVEGHTVIRRLIEATDNQFSFRVLGLSQTGDLMTATVELELPGLGARQQIGVQRIVPNGGEDLVKGAITDGLKKAATLFGVGLELYEKPDAAGANGNGYSARPAPVNGNGPGRRPYVGVTSTANGGRS